MCLTNAVSSSPELKLAHEYAKERVQVSSFLRNWIVMEFPTPNQKLKITVSFAFRHGTSN